METSYGSFKAKKLLRMKIDHIENTIRSIRITGDFFIYPEEAIIELEKSLVGVSIDSQSIKIATEAFFSDNQVIGFDEHSLAEAIIHIVSEGKDEHLGSCFK